jgi:hypothetical protein
MGKNSVGKYKGIYPTVDFDASSVQPLGSATTYLFIRGNHIYDKIVFHL